MSRSGSSLAALAVTVACAALGVGCGSDEEVRSGEVAPALERLDLDLRYRDIPEPEGIDDLVAGRASRGGASVDFAVLVGDAALTTDRSPIVRYMGVSSGIGIGNALVITNASNAPVRRRAVHRARGRIAVDIEQAVCELAPEVPCAP